MTASSEGQRQTQSVSGQPTAAELRLQGGVSHGWLLRDSSWHVTLFIQQKLENGDFPSNANGEQMAGRSHWYPWGVWAGGVSVCMMDGLMD